MTRNAGVAAVVFLLAFGLPGAARHDGPHGGPDDEVFNVGRNGDVKIDRDVAIGDVLVKNGKYLFEHRVHGGAHILMLSGLDTKEGSKAPVHQIRMPWLPSRDPVKNSALFAERLRNRSYRVGVIQIAGEAGNHIPDRVGTT